MSNKAKKTKKSSKKDVKKDVKKDANKLKHDKYIEIIVFSLILVLGIVTIAVQTYRKAQAHELINEAISVCESTLKGKYTYEISTTATTTLGQRYGYERVSNGVISPSFTLEYLTNEDSEVPYILNLKLGDSYYINDGILENEDNKMEDVGIGFSKTEHPQGAWYALINALDTNWRKYTVTKELQKEGVDYVLTTTDYDEIGRHLGYERDSKATKKKLSLIISLTEDNELKGVSTVLNVTYPADEVPLTDETIVGKTIIENHIQKVTNFTPYTESISLPNFNLAQMGNDIYRLDESMLSAMPSILNDVPFGASTISISTDNGMFLVGKEMDSEFVATLMKDTTQINDSTSENALYMTTLDFSRGQDADVYFNDESKLFLGVRYRGDFTMPNLHYGMTKQQIDEYRVGAGFIRYNDYEPKDTWLYTGFVGGIPYVVEVSFKQDRVVGVGILPFYLYTAEQDALDIIKSGGAISTPSQEPSTNAAGIISANDRVTSSKQE